MELEIQTWSYSEHSIHTNPISLTERLLHCLLKVEIIANNDCAEYEKCLVRTMQPK